MILRWCGAAFLLILCLWFAYLTMYNLWAAGGPPTPNPQTYATRANVFLALACASFASFLVIVVQNLQRRKRTKKASA